jgi:hypothetical protein
MHNVKGVWRRMYELLGFLLDDSEQTTNSESTQREQVSQWHQRQKM